MQTLYKPKSYPPAVALEINKLGTRFGVAIANRWMLGWEADVKAMLKDGTYLDALKAQSREETRVFAESPHLDHLSDSERMEVAGLSLSP